MKNFQMKTGKFKNIYNINIYIKYIYLKVFISVNLISALTNKDDGQFPAKLNRVHGEVAHMQINCR